MTRRNKRRRGRKKAEKKAALKAAPRLSPVFAHVAFTLASNRVRHKDTLGPASDIRSVDDETRREIERRYLEDD